MTDKKTINSLVKYCQTNLDFENAGKGWEYYYASMPLCVVDSVFSIGVRYEGVENTVKRLVNYYNIETRAKRKHSIPKTESQISTTKFLKLFKKKSPKNGKAVSIVSIPTPAGTGKRSLKHFGYAKNIHQTNTYLNNYLTAVFNWF